jgi:signal transduction histidine kinase
MKLNKKIETEVLKIYDTWMHSYLNGDVEIYDSFLDDEYHFIGSATKEEFLNRKDTTQFFADTGDQFAGKTEIRNESKTIEQFNELIFITHIFDGWFLNENDWNFYARFRFSSTLRKNKDGWRFIYQHFSIPDSKTDEGETIGYNKINDENQELREAIKRRTFELEAKNKELEIEAALERVRTQSMGMQSSEDLSKVTTEMFNQLRQFKADLFATGIVFCDKHKGHVEQWHSLPDAGMMSPFIVPIDLDYIHQYRYDQWKKGSKLFSIEIQENVIEQHFNDIFQLPSAQKVLKEFEANKTPMPSTPVWEIDYGASFKYGYLLVSSLQPFKEADILPRFAKVFEQTYTRFLDLQKAEAQAREAQIDLALERIRSQAMAMKESSDLLDIVVTMRNEFINLGHEAHYFWHMMWLSETYEKAMTSGDGTKIGFVMKLPRHMHGDIPLLAKWEKSKKPTVVYTMNADKAINYVDKMVDLGDFKSIDPQAPSHDDIRHIGGLTFIMARTSHGEIGYSLPGIVKNPPKEDINILIQFAGAFDLAHRRFLDLQKSEKQARETQIELALEKVRSRTMAMQRSEELADVASVLFLQVKELGIEQWTCGFNIWEKGDTEFKYFPGGPDGKMLPSCMVPLMEHPVFREFVESKKRDDALMVYEKEGKIQKDHYKYMLSLPGIGDMLQGVLDQGIEFPDFQIDHIANFAYGNIVFITYQPVPEMHDVFKRFAKVFEQTYTRFLDLQKAEAQTREAQIETALERVRARTMAMHKSDELKEVIQVVNDQFVHLKINTEHTGFVMDYKARNDYDIWIADQLEVPSHVIIPYFDSVYYNRFNEAKKKGEDFFSTNLPFKEKNKFYKKLIEYVPELPEKSKEYLFSVPGLAASTVLLDNVCLYIENFEGIPYTDEENDILMRFGKVFQQTYTRFLDLQKVEAQARESQIELGLERVRARAMAMQHSNELSDLVATVLNELTKLDFSLTWCIINIINEADHSNMIWAINPEGGTEPESYYMKFEDYPYHHATIKAWKAKKPKFVYILEGKEKKIYDDYLYNKTEFKRFSNKAKKANRALDRYVASFTFSNFGGLQTISSEPLSDENLEILERFGKVFDMTYTRFNDLQKAEAQAREAQIETALERVRSRSMAMHNSTEIGDVAFVLFQQLKSLGGELWGTGFGFCKKDSDVDVYWFANENGIMPPLKIPNNIDPTHKQMYQGWKKNLELFSIAKEGKELKEHYKYMLTVPDVQPIFQNILDSGMAFPKWQKWHAAYFKYGYLLVITTETYDNEFVFKRFAKVFEQAYTRFLDLQKAEAQIREAQIETALERIRSRSMAMQQSSELLEAGELLWNEIVKLGVDCFTSGYVLMDENENIGWNYTPNPSTGKILEQAIGIPHKQTPPMRKIVASWKTQEPLCVIELTRKQTIAHQTFVAEKGINFPFSAKQLVEISPKEIVLHTFNFKQGYLLIVAGEKISEEQIDLMLRFTKVFQQTYTRFLDLLKAEAQTREAQIEMALEKVRSRTMAMQKGQEVKDVVVLLYKELITLGVTNFATCGYVEVNEETNRQATWVTNPGGDSLGLFHLPLTGDVHFDERYEAWKNQQPIFHQTVAGKERKKHLEYAITTFNSKEAEEMVLTQFPDPTVFYCFNFSHGYLHLVAGSYLNEEEENLLARFTRVFEQTYARFLDLEKAEAQTRQAQINLAVERVRAKALAMHKSEEIMEVVVKLKDEVMGLDIPDVVASTIFLNEDDDKVRMWDLSSLEHEENYSEVPFDITFKLKKSDPHLYVKRVWENPKDYFVEKQDEKDFKRLMVWLREQHKNEIADEVEDHIEKAQLKRLYHTVKKLNNGKLVIDLLNPPTEEMESILTKMGAAFDLAYKRFEDLKKAEAQTREALIEAALEKVRSRSLAMHKPEELQEVVAVVAEKLQELGVIYDAGGVILCTYFPDNKNVVHWIAVDDFSTSGRYFVPYFDNPIFSEAWDSKIRGDAFFSKEFPVEAKNDFFKHAFEHSDYKHMPEDYKQYVLQADKHYLSAAWSKNSAILMPSLTGTVPSENDAKIIKRFAKVFEQAYIRFMDLQKAEAQTRESLIEIGLERVRSRTLAMQTSEELAETAVVLFKQLIDLGIAPNRLFIGIIKDEGTSIEAWATNEDGSKIASQFTLQASKNKSIKKMLTGWKQDKKSLVIDMKGKELQDYFHYLSDEMNIPFIGGLEQKRRVQTIAYFSGGLIGMAAPNEQSEDSMRLLDRFASVFNLTYTRFKDLKVAEAQAKKAEEDLIKLQLAKQSAEKALSELQLTQTQLIQSEKMASLGELTAGIAHEIQNPLNFVNNFSEVSKELLDEMLEEIENGDMEEVKTIMNDIIQNLEKINHHGKRADGIVKGMLQHSRSSTGAKEPTNINVLADEYLRLAYHGLRAKDKSFNATLVTDFDENIGKINIIPQDIGRVVLNLLTNAFYVVNEKKHLHVNGYEPTVSLTTKKHGNWVTISVKDNGNGIPQKVLDKIFQPFFTTKPTGQGTGLGLSMSYDIVTKGHGGELKVETEPEVGTEFIISLPL